MVEVGDQVEVFKGTHQLKSGMIVKAHRVCASIRFNDGSKGKTLPSSLRITTPIVESVPNAEESRNNAAQGSSSPGNLEEYRSISVDVLTELLAQGLALSEQHDEQLSQRMNNLRGRVLEIRRGG